MNLLVLHEFIQWATMAHIFTTGCFLPINFNSRKLARLAQSCWTMLYHQRKINSKYLTAKETLWKNNVCFVAIHVPDVVIVYCYDHGVRIMVLVSFLSRAVEMAPQSLTELCIVLHDLESGEMCCEQCGCPEGYQFERCPEETSSRKRRDIWAQPERRAACRWASCQKLWLTKSQYFHEWLVACSAPSRPLPEPMMTQF